LPCVGHRWMIAMRSWASSCEKTSVTLRPMISVVGVCSSRWRLRATAGDCGRLREDCAVLCHHAEHDAALCKSREGNRAARQSRNVQHRSSPSSRHLGTTGTSTNSDARGYFVACRQKETYSQQLGTQTP
jgi:hypothetical protein